MSIKRLIKSFKYAFWGFVHTVKTEQNMRIHLVIGNLIILFAYFFGIEKHEWALLFITIGFVIFAEMINTAVERLADAITKEHNINIKYAKDVSAAGVTVAAISAVLVGVCLFGNEVRILNTINIILKSPKAMMAFLCLFIADGVLLFKVKGRKEKQGK